jgi:hypothetical protein
LVSLAARLSIVIIWTFPPDLGRRHIDDMP